MKLLAVIGKNLRRMLSSKITLGFIFLIPFILLFLIQGIYVPSENLSISVGITVSNDPMMGSISSAIEKGFPVINYTSLDACLESLKRGNINVCLEKKDNDLIFHLDYSKVKLADAIMDHLSGLLSKNAENLRIVFLEGLVQKMQENSLLLTNLSKEFDLSVANDSSLSKINDLNKDFADNRKSILVIKKSLDNVSSESENTFLETKSSLGVFNSQLNSMKNKAEDQKEKLRDARVGSYDCEVRYLPSPSEFEQLPHDELQNALVSYGECKCVDVYKPTLVNAENNLDDVIDSTKTAKNEISQSNIRNEQFFRLTQNSVDLQKSKLSDFEKEINDSEKTLTKIHDDLQDKLISFGNSLRNMSDGSKMASTQLVNDSNLFTKPTIISIDPLSTSRDLFVYLFPLLFLLIMMFVSLLLSATFSYSEKHSLARFRNHLSPLSNVTHVLGLFLSLLIIFLIQSVLLLLLSNIFFSLGLTFGIILKILLVTLLFLSLTILIGILIGGFIRSHLLVILLAVGVTLLTFMYSTMSLALELATPFVRTIISYNPYVLASDLISKMILYNANFDVLLLCVYTIILFGLTLLSFNYFDKVN